MSYLFVPGSVDSTSESDSPAPRHEPSVSWRGKHSQPRSWSRVCKTAPWTKLLSGLTSPPSTVERGAASWISSLRATRASRSRTRDGATEPMTLAICGRTSPASSVSANPDLFSSRTSPAIYRSDSMRSARNFTAWATALRREYSRRPRSALRTDASACSRWPTATSSDSSFDGTPRNGIKGNHNLSLNEAANRWPTPTCTDTTAEGRGKRNNPTLSDSANRWATPSAHDGRRPGSDEASTQGRNLKREAESWATPTGSDGGSTRRGGDRRDELLLGGQAQAWATPAARYWKGANGPERLPLDQSPNQVRFGFPSGPQPPTTPQDGPMSGPTRPAWSRQLLVDHIARWLSPNSGGLSEAMRRVATGASVDAPPPRLRRSLQEQFSGRATLNPLFVEWLMGWPPGWTDFAPLGTESSRWWRRMRSELSQLNSREAIEP